MTVAYLLISPFSTTRMCVIAPDIGGFSSRDTTSEPFLDSFQMALPLAF